MKIINILGGLGNQMFQYAFALALKFNKPNDSILIDVSNFNHYPLHNGYELDKIFNLTIKHANFKDLIKIPFPMMNYNLWRVGSRLLRFLPNYYSEKKYRKNFYDINNLPFNGYFDGYWQSEIYFNKFRDKILKEFTFPELTDEKNVELLHSINNKQTASIHIRRGDYINNKAFSNICTTKYYKNAIRTLRNITKIDTILLFSNDIEWCKLEFKEELEGLDPIFVDWNKGLDSYKDMQLMSLCKHNIIANSTFSWWGAWLNQNPNKIVISPYKWNNLTENHSHFIPESWIKITDIN